MMMTKKSTSMKMARIDKNKAEADREKVGEDDTKIYEDDKIN